MTAGVAALPSYISTFVNFVKRELDLIERLSSPMGSLQVLPAEPVPIRWGSMAGSAACGRRAARAPSASRAATPPRRR
jgi:hypothetical protein